MDLIYNRLYTEEDDNIVIKLVRKLPWEEQAPKWIKKCILELNLHANYESIYQLASLLSGLAKYRDAFVIDVIDSLFENIQLSIERNDFREAPLRVRQLKLLGELYNYRLIDSNIVFDTMYLLIGFGGPTMYKASHMATAHKVLERALAARRAGLGSISEEGAAAEDAPDVGGSLAIPPILADPQHPIEQPWDFFRIKLVCVLLETCGHYFDRGVVKTKLDRFLQFFMRYVLAKGELPLRVSYMVGDMLERLRPKLKIPTELAESDKQILKLLQSERETLDLEEDKDDKDDEEAKDEDDSSSSSSEDDDDSSSGEGGESEEESESDSEEEEDGGKGKGRGRMRDEDYNRGTAENEEEDEFEKEVQQMLIDSLEREKHVQRGMLSELPTLPQTKRPEGAQPMPGMFSLMQKRQGGKVVMKDIDIPEDSRLARVAMQGDEDQSQEKAELKRYIIEYDKMSSAPGISPGNAGIGVPMQLGGSRATAPIHIQLRPGKGTAGGKAAGRKAKGSGGRLGRRNEDYLKDSLLPDEEQESEALPPPPPPRHQGGSGAGGHRPIGKGSGSAGGCGGKGRRPEPLSSKSATPTQPQGSRGTPSQAAVRGSL